MTIGLTRIIVFTAILSLVMVSPVIADTVSAKGEIVSIDAAKRQISVKRKTSKGEKTGDFVVSKKASISIGGELADFYELESGQSISLTYDTQAKEVVSIKVEPIDKPNTKTDSTTTSPKKRNKSSLPELLVIKELDTEANDSGPCLSPDGLTIYWQVKTQSDVWVWTAQRKTPDSLFTDAKRVLPGGDPAVTGDGLELIISDGPTNSYLSSSRRQSILEPFGRPKQINELPPNVARPFLAYNGLTLWFESMQPPHSFMVSTRSSREDFWMKPEKVSVAKEIHDKMIYSSYSTDGQLMFCSSKADEYQGTNLLVLSRKNVNARFGEPRFVSCPGISAYGTFPRYVQSTNELFFSGALDRNAKTQNRGIMVIKNFDPTRHLEKN